MGKLIEGFWDCPYCGEKHIGGLQMKCTSCGASRGEDIKFYMDDPKNYIDDEKAKTISKNPDWLCSYCGAYNSDNNPECKNCGATRTESEKNYFEIRKKKEEREKQEKAEEYKEIINDNSESEEESSDYGDKASNDSNDNNDMDFNKFDETGIRSEKGSSFNWKKLLAWGGIGLGIVSIIATLIFIFTPKTQEGIVDSFAWQRSISIEEYKTLNESDWVLPAKARLQYTQEEIKTYERVVDHYETKTRTYTEQVLDHYETVVTGHQDNGNGTFTEITAEKPVYRTETKTETYEEPVYRDEPVYATKYYYEIDRWMHKDYIKTSGEDKNPYWGEYQYKEKEREGSKTENYEITVINKEEKVNTYSVDYDVWKNLEKGETVHLKVYVNGYAELITEENTE